MYITNNNTDIHIKLNIDDIDGLITKYKLMEILPVFFTGINLTLSIIYVIIKHCWD